MNKKYELKLITNISSEVYMNEVDPADKFYNKGGHDVYRIIALKDFSDVKKGDLGGFVEYEDNLSHDGDAWIYDNTWVSGDAKYMGMPWYLGVAAIFGDVQVFGMSR